MRAEAKPGGVTAKLAQLLRRRFRLLAAIIAAAIGGLTISATAPVTAPLDGMLFDTGVAARWYLNGQQTANAQSVAVVGIDWNSLRQPELAPMPRALFGPVWANLIDSLIAAGAKAIVFDMVFEFQGNAFIANYDRPFLQALARHRGKVVLARTGQISPARPFMIAAGPSPAIALSEYVPDRDGVVRQVVTSFADENDRPYPTLSGAALLSLGRPLPHAPVRLHPTGPLEFMVPTYPLMDTMRLSASAEGRKSLAGLVRDRVVFVGSVLAEEDRKIAPDRFLLDAVAPPQTGGTPATLGISAPQSGSIPGVMIHAAAVSAILDDHGMTDAPFWLVGLLAATVAAIMAGVATSLSPMATASISILTAASLVGGSWALPLARIYLPVGHALLSLVVALLLAFGLRYISEQRRRLKLQHAFGHYLAPAVVNQLVHEEAPPELGGETREITCMFADLSGFTALSTQLEPAALMAITNRYLDLITSEVDRTGGYVDKYIGDAVMAMWNAPLAYPDHPLRAVEAAMAAAEAVRREHAAATSLGQSGFTVKIGLNTGPAVVGNMGASKRFNYTAVGEAVNVAARLEPVPPVYNCAIIISEGTAARLTGHMAVCELDLVSVKGKDVPLRIFTPLSGPPESHETWLVAWNHALNAYRARNFTAAAQAWRAQPLPWNWPEAEFGPAIKLAERAETLAAEPPATWSGIWAVGKA